MLDADDALREAGVLQHSLDAADDVVCAVQHLLGVAGQPDFTLGGVDEQGVHGVLGLQLDVSREACAAQTQPLNEGEGVTTGDVVTSFNKVWFALLSIILHGKCDKNVSM